MYFICNKLKRAFHEYNTKIKLNTLNRRLLSKEITPVILACCEKW